MPSIHTRIFQVAALACVAGLAACVSVTPYQPASKGYGYSEQRIENNRFRINFAGNSDTPKQTVETYLLFRAAELTLKSGYDYFVFASDSTDASTRYLQSFDGFYGGWGPYYWGPRSAFGGGFGASTSTPITEYVAQANVVMFKGKKPDTDVHAFDAREVRTNLEPAILRPVPKS